MRTFGDTRTEWHPHYDARRRRGVMEIHVYAADGSRRTAMDVIAMRPFERATVQRALVRCGLELLEERPLTGTTLGPHTGRIGYLARTSE